MTAAVALNSRWLPSTMTVNVPSGGTELASSASSKLMLNAAPFTVADTNDGAVVSAALSAWRAATLASALPDVSFSTLPLAGLS